MISAMLEVAMRHALEGRLVFPCSKKKPLVPGGFKKASLHPEDLSDWWSKYPDAQVGLPTGKVNHLFALDIDGPQAEAYVEKMKLPDTFTVETSPGHKQLWFHQPEDVTTRCSASVLAPELDVRGDGGYVIAPGSIHHETRRPYRALNDLPWAEMPPQLLQAVTVNGNASGSVPADAIPQGRRHQTMLSMAGALRARGLAPSSVLAALTAVNERQCAPSLPIAEVEKLAQYVGTKPPGFRGATMETTAEVDLEYFSETPREQVKWLWPGRFPRGKVTIIAGMPGVGKSLGTIDVASRVSRGAAFPDGSPCEQGEALILSAEDDAKDTIGPRLDAAGADSSRVARIKAVKVTLADGAQAESFFDLGRDLEKLEEAIKKHPQMALIVIDPLSAYLGKIDSHKDAEVRQVLTPLVFFAQRTRVAVVGIMHLNKSEMVALLRLPGSIGFSAAARVVWLFAEHPDDPKQRVMVPMVNKLGALGTGLGYQIAAKGGVPYIVWQSDPVTMDADTVLATGKKPGPEPEAVNEAAEYLEQGVLADGPKPVKEIEAQARKDGFSWATIRRAKDKLGVRAFKNSLTGGWSWRLPPEDAQVRAPKMLTP